MKGDYGVDAPPALLALAGTGVALVAVTVVVWLAAGAWWALIPLAYALLMLASSAVYLHTTRRGKFVVWRELLAGLALRGDETVLDLGCGRGAVLVTAARSVPGGRAVGVDLWRWVDQSGNDPARTRANAAAEGVAVKLLTGDMRALPVGTGSVDVVVSSMAIHNIPGERGRLSAVAEAYRVLRPGGRLVVADFRHGRRYAEELTRLGCTDVRVRGLGWRFWYGGPWASTAVVTATHP